MSTPGMNSYGTSIDTYLETDPENSRVYLRTTQRRVLSGEERLMLAVLQSALAERRSGNPRLSAEAELFFLVTDHSWPFSFASICEQLGLDAEAVRGAIRTPMETAGS